MGERYITNHVGGIVVDTGYRLDDRHPSLCGATYARGNGGDGSGHGTDPSHTHDALQDQYSVAIHHFGRGDCGNTANGGGRD